MTSSTEKIAAKSAHLGSPRVSTALSRALGAPRSAMTWEKIAANTMMSMTMEVGRTVSRKVWRIARQERLPYQGQQHADHGSQRRRFRRRDDAEVHGAEHD